MYQSILANGANTIENIHYFSELVVRMEWNRTFRPERKADWGDIADSIRSSVTMDDVIRYYTPDIRTRNHRCPCPFHNGKDYNFSYTRNWYKCFVCGVSGDVITYVKDIRDMSTRVDAMKRINADLHLNLPIDGNVSEEEGARFAALRAERERKEKEEAEWLDTYHRLMDEWVSLDREKRTADPSSDEYADAVKRIDIVGHQLDCHLNKRAVISH